MPPASLSRAATTPASSDALPRVMVGRAGAETLGAAALRRAIARTPSLTAPAVTAVVGAGACVFVALADPTTPGGVTPSCPTKALFGVTCPGCGTARMLYCLLRGDLVGAAHFNAVALLAVPLLLWSYLTWVWSKTTRKPLSRWQDWRWSPVVVAGVLTLWFVVRLLPMEPFAALRV